MIIVVLSLAAAIGYTVDLAYGYVSNDHGTLTGNFLGLGDGQQNAVKSGGYIIYGADYVNSYSSLSCGAIDYPIINRIPLLGFYHQESYTGRPTATHLSVPQTKDYTMLGSQTVVGTTGTLIDSSLLRGDASIAYFQPSYIASLLTGFTGDTIKDSKSFVSVRNWFNVDSDLTSPLSPHVSDGLNEPSIFYRKYVEFTEIDGETLRFTTEHPTGVFSATQQNSRWAASNSITLNGLDGFQDQYFLKSFRILDGVGSITAEIDRGDIILSLSTLSGITNDKVVNVYPDASMGPFNMIDSMTQDIPELHLRYWAVNEGAALEDLFTHTGAGDWTTLYILKPIYVPNGPDSVDNFELVVPDYAWSNVGFIQCEHSVYNPGLDYTAGNAIRTQFVETAVVAVDCQDTLATPLPANAYVNAISATMDDLIPHDFCSEDGNSSPTNQPIPIEIPDVPTGTMYSDYIDYFVNDAFGGPDVSSIYFRPNPDKFPGGATFVNSTGGTDLINVCMGETSYSQQASGSKPIGGDQILVVSVSLERSGSPNVFDSVVSPQDTLNVSCNNLAIQDTATGLLTQLGAENKQFDSRIPYYLTMIESVNNNDFGWGTYQSDDTDSTQPNQFVMGMPFIAVLAILSAFSGFNGKYIIPSVIIYLMLISSFAYLEIISVPESLLAGLVMLGVIAIFSKGFR